MAYTHVQLIAYQMYTLTPFKTRFTSPSVDARMRMYSIFDVMKFCDEHLSDDEPTTLKIFVAPEFYGKSPDGKSDGTGHYDPGVVWRSFEGLRAKCREAGDFRHWLVIPGTFVTAEKIGPKTVIFNSVYAFKGDGNLFRILHKKDFSSIDGLDVTLRGGNQHYKQLSDLSRGTPTQQSTPIQVGNLSIGVEICRDHLLARLRKSLAKKAKTTPPLTKDGVDVQVLTVCGMSVGDDAVATKDKGYVFRVEGHPAHSTLPAAVIERFSVSWQNQVMDSNINLTPHNHAYLEDLPQELQINIACDLSASTAADVCSAYLISDALPIQTV